MNSEPRRDRGARACRCEGIGTTNVLLQVVQVADTEVIEDGPDARNPAQTRMGHVDADLEIDEVGAAIVADDDVLALVEVNVSDAANVHLAERSAKRREEIRREPARPCPVDGRR